MKQFTILIVFFCYFTMVAQQKNIKGTVLQSNNMPAATIEIQILDGQMGYIQSITTDSLGQFEFETEILPIHIHLDSYSENPVFVKVDEQMLSEPLVLHLQADDQQLDELTISVKRPTIKQQTDRLIFDVQNSTISNLNTWEILQRTPNITTRNGNLQVRNNSNIIVTINDKKWLMSPQELQTLLENTPGEELESIEVITNPPAQYEAAGAAIVNIKLKQNKLLGFKGTLYSKYEQSMYAKGLFGTSMFYNVGKWNFAASYYRGMGNYVRKSDDYLFYEEDQTTWKTITNRKDTNKSQNTWNTLIGYQLDPLTTITVGMNGVYQPNSHGFYNIPTTITDANNEVLSQFNTLNDHKSKRSQLNYHAQIQKKIDNHTLSSTLQFTNNSVNKFQDIVTLRETTVNNFRNDEDNSTKVLSFQVDDSYKNDKFTWDNGVKFSSVSAHFKLDFSDNAGLGLNHNPQKSNDFTYDEQNYAAYTSVNYALDKWAFKAGLRAEYTNLKGLVDNPLDVNKQHYLQWFPTAYIQRTFENSHQLVLSYGKRISRPYYAWLNPAKSYYSDFSYFQGDPRLKPTLIHNVEVNYSFKSAVITPYYSYKKAPAMEINFQNAADKTLIYKYTNIKDEQSVGLQVYKNFEITPRFSFDVSANTEYRKQLFWGFDEQIYENKRWTYDGRLNVQYQLDPETSWTVNASYLYVSPGIQGTFTFSSISSTSLQTSRKFFNKALEATLAFNDIFYTEKINIKTRYANQNNYFRDSTDTQKAMLTLRYHFGNQKVKALQRVDKSEEQKRL